MKHKICIVISQYYPEISKKLLDGAAKELKKKSISTKNKIFVSGVFEIPVAISRVIKKFDAFIAIGCVIKGKTPHFNLISKSTTEAIMSLSVDSKKPIGNSIISCFSKKQALIRASKNKVNKGQEAARAVLSVLGKLNLKW